MTSGLIDYACSPYPRRRWMTPARLMLIVASSLALFILPFISVRQTRARIDAITGSVESQTVWPFGITAGASVNVSPLETRLKNMGVAWTPSWRFLHETDCTIFGRANCRACASPPPIYQLQPVSPQFVAASSDEEIRSFVRIMQTGTDAQQRAAIDAAVEKALR